MSRWLFANLAILSLSPLMALGGEYVEIRVFPESVSLDSKRDRQSLIVQGVTADGLTQDLTESCKWSLDHEQFVRQEGHDLLPVADGAAQLTVTYEGLTKSIPVTVKNAQVEPPISFKLDVMPIFMKTGCNTGSCHGAARGKDGFRLSLFGYDPDGDYFRLTQEQPGRRLNFAVPEASLLLEKAIGAVTHTGGKRFDDKSLHHARIAEWIRKGAKPDPADQITCTGIELSPRQAVLDGEGEKQQLVVVAQYSDGSTRDVTSLASFFSSNDSSAAIDEAGLITAGDRGEAFVMARFDVYTQGAQVLTLPKGLQYEAPPTAPVNFIDELVAEKLQKIRLLPSELCSDEEFLRRITIDLTGLLPTVEEYNAFMSSTDPAKRTQKIDELLASREFTDLWVGKWAEWLMMRSDDQRLSEKAIHLYYQWLVQQLDANVPLDKMVRDLLTGTGSTFTQPQTNFYQITRDQLKVTENVAQVFIGTRIQCAQCHNHPFDRWTQDDYYNFAAFFTQIGRKQAEDPREQIIFNRGGGEVKHPVTGANAVPKFLGGESPDVKGKDRRELLADWLVSPENPYFATNFANRVWQHFFGRGIVEPVDDFRISNPPSNPALLDALSHYLIDHDYDFRKLVREICLSNTYQRSTRRNDSNRSDEQNFAHQNIRRIKAESALDIISQVTSTSDSFPRIPSGGRAVQITDGQISNYFLQTFGRATRETACSCEVRMEPNLSQALHLINGDTVNTKMQQGKVLKQLQDQSLPPREIVEQLYITCLTRKPTDQEWEALAPLFAEGNNVSQGLEDVFWALLNSREFLFNH